MIYIYLKLFKDVRRVLGITLCNIVKIPLNQEILNWSIFIFKYILVEILNRYILPIFAHRAQNRHTASIFKKKIKNNALLFEKAASSSFYLSKMINVRNLNSIVARLESSFVFADASADARTIHSSVPASTIPDNDTTIPPTSHNPKKKKCKHLLRIIQDLFYN